MGLDTPVVYALNDDR